MLVHSAVGTVPAGTVMAQCALTGPDCTQTQLSCQMDASQATAAHSDSDV